VNFAVGKMDGVLGQLFVTNNFLSTKLKNGPSQFQFSFTGLQLLTCGIQSVNISYL